MRSSGIASQGEMATAEKNMSQWRTDRQTAKESRAGSDKQKRAKIAPQREPMWRRAELI